MRTSTRARSPAFRPLPEPCRRVRADCHPKLAFLFEPHRYKIVHGGRGGGKSWQAARALLALGIESPLRVLCAREHQGSIADSVHRLLCDQIRELEMTPHYRVTADTIRGRNGTEFIFAGLKHNIADIRSKEGVDICWVEEAQGVSRRSWDTLIPTIRKAGSEIWVTFNPDLEEDETWQRFVVRPPAGAKVEQIGYRENLWFPAVLNAEQEALKARDPEAWAHVWDGQCRRAVEGSIYGADLARAREEGRLATVPYEPSAPVHCFWDLGWADSVSVWMAQSVGLEFRVIDFLSGSQHAIDWYVSELNKRPYVWGEDWLPHDAAAKTLAAAGRTIRSQLVELGRRTRMVERLSVTDGINAARGVLGRCWFDQDRCADGLHALRHYRYAVGEDGRLTGQPLHDWSSHAADAFRYLAISLRAQRPRTAKVQRDRPPLGWMA